MRLEDLYKCELHDVPAPALENLKALLPKLEKLEAAYDRPFQVTSGFRTWTEHKAIYRRINDQRIVQKKSEIPLPLHSQHLNGNACDVLDGSQELKIWVAKNMPLIEDLDLYFEAFKYTPNWIHIQCVAPGSGNRFFIP